MATNAEVFRVPEDYALTGEDGAPLDPGYYYWYVQPGCLPDSDAFGPFPTAAEAEAEARSEDPDDGDDAGPDVAAIRGALDGADDGSAS